MHIFVVNLRQQAANKVNYTFLIDVLSDTHFLCSYHVTIIMKNLLV